VSVPLSGPVWRPVAVAGARVAFGLLATLCAVTFVASLPEAFRHLQQPCRSDGCEPRLDAAGLHALSDAGIDLRWYAAGFLLLYVAFAVLCLVIAVQLARRATGVMAVVVAAMLVSFGVSFPYTVNDLVAHHPGWRIPGGVVEMTSQVAFVAFAYWFPARRPQPHWTLVPVAVWSLLMLPTQLAPGSVLALSRLPGGVQGLLVIGCLGPIPFVQLRRLRRLTDPVQRQQVKWVAWGLAVGVGGLVGLSTMWTSGSLPAVQRGHPVLAAVAQVSTYAVVAALPVSIGMAVARHRLFGVDTLIRRSLVYTGTVAALALTYAVVVVLLSGILPRTGGPALAATVAVALVVVPVRDLLRRGVSRLFYGDRDEPAAALRRLSGRLAESGSPGSMVQRLADEVAGGLRLPRVEVWFDGRPVAVSGTEGSRPPTILPIRYDGVAVGELRVVPRPGEDVLEAGDRRLLAEVVDRAGTVVHAEQASRALHASMAELADSRRRLVLAQADERARIQRDLHDELGPALAGVQLRLEATLDRLGGHQPVLAAELEALHRLVRDCSREVRGIVHGLRPGALQQLALCAAIEEHCRAVARSTGMTVTLATDDLPDDRELGPALEDAAYRIVQEALLNAHRHGEARRASVRLMVNDGRLVLTVTDDGCGPGSGLVTPSGTGVAGMRSRVGGLGGSFALAQTSTGGAEVRVCLPLPPVAT
jgi:signal transduction histidine kinase